MANYKTEAEREKHNKPRREWARRNPEKVKEIQERYLEKNPNYMKEYREKHKDTLQPKINAYLKEKRKNDPEYGARLRYLNKKSITKNFIKKATKADLMELFNIANQRMEGNE